MRVVDADGAGVARYRYDPYGNLIYSTGDLVSINPLRYRSYYYDSETGFYYLQSRYYDPEIGRFINADDFASTGQGILGHNMFAYCLSNPTNFIDHSGSAAIHNQAHLHIERNKGYDYITDQDDPAIADKHLGLATISHGGCGVVASYNALITLGASKSFDDVLAYFNKSMYRVFGCGLTGLLPQDIAYYFASLGYTVCITSQKSQIDELSRTSDACIMYYEFPQTYTILNCIPINAYGAHFVEYSRTSGNYLGRNTSEGNGTYPFSSPYDYGSNGPRYYVVGIFIYK